MNLNNALAALRLANPDPQLWSGDAARALQRELDLLNSQLTLVAVEHL